MAAWFRLSLLFSLAGLMASRIGLLVHEFLGHGGMASVLGGELPHWRLFLFGGGWIQYQRDPWYTPGQELAIALAGVGCETIVAALLWLIAYRLGALARGMLRIAALLLWAHVCVYIATGTHYGFGDGMILHTLLALGWRLLLVLVLCLIMASMAYGLAKQGLILGATLEIGGGVRRLAWTSLAILVAAGLHAGLYYGERALIDTDQTYEALMQREVERRAAQYEASLAAQRELVGQPWSEKQAETARVRYVEEHEPWPLRPVLLVLGLLAGAFGGWRFRRTETDKLVPWRLAAIRGPSGLLVVALAAIVVIDALG